MLLSRSLRRRYRKWVTLASFTALLQLACAIVPPAGLLLCFGADGHFEVEAPHDGRECHDVPGDEQQGGDCKDVELAGLKAAESPGLRVPEVATPLLSVVRPQNLSPFRPTACVLHAWPVPEASARAARSTIVLIV